jgi:hypothetical protein
VFDFVEILQLGKIFRFFLTQSDSSPLILRARREIWCGDDSGVGPQEWETMGGVEMAVNGSRWVGQWQPGSSAGLARLGSSTAAELH